jgi:hypothetical protein
MLKMLAHLLKRKSTSWCPLPTTTTSEVQFAFEDQFFDCFVE